MTLAQLIKQCKQNNDAAQKELYNRYVIAMFLVCKRYVKHDGVAEECMLNGFLHFYNSLHRFTYQSDAATTAWLKKIMVNECLQQLRHDNSFLLVADAEAIDVAVDENALGALEADEIYKLILRLPVGYRTVFNLYVLEGMSHKQIAAALGIKEGTSKSQLSKAKQLLQMLLINRDGGYAARNAK